MRRLILTKALIMGLTSFASAQKSDFTLEDIFQKGVFRTAFAPGFNEMKDGEHYTELIVRGSQWYILKKQLRTGDSAGVIINGAQAGLPNAPEDYTFSEDESRLIFTYETEAIYRHSRKAMVHVSTIGGSTVAIPGGKVMYPTLSPDNRYLAYVRDNNLYVFNLETRQETAITTDGRRNEIINGAVDWVYEEEFSMSRGFEWSPDSRHLAFYRFDESGVKEFSMDMFTGLYPTQERWKYPKAGEDNSVVDVYIHTLDQGRSVRADLAAGDQYLPRIKWTREPGLLSIQWLNRTQNHWKLLFAHAATGATETVLEETSKTYVDITDNLIFLKKSKAFILTSEKNGYNHIYLYTFKTSKPGKGKPKTITGTWQESMITKGNWDVIGLYRVDEDKRLVYYTGSEVSPTEDHLFSIDFQGKKKVNLTPEPGHHAITFGTGGKYFTDMHSSFGQPNRFVLHHAETSWQRVLEDNAAAARNLEKYNFGSTSFGQLTTDSGISLNYWMIKPHNFDPNKKYPVLMFVYGGPGVNTVRNNWGGRNYLYHQYLSQKGYIVVSVDGRGTGNRGEQFKKCTYLQLGKLEHQDQAAAARWLAKQPFVDGSRIGIWGWSFGGYMSSLCITKTPETFKTAVAVAPVTNWRYYDNIYTERFLRKPSENPTGYDDNSPINFVKNIRGNYLIVHGTGDDNVHWQNTAEMINAMIKAGVRYDSELYPNRNHGIGDGRAQYHLYRRMAEYILSNL